ncbi:MAG TPA: chemotaxis protein CheW [Caldilineaceae bacterium]|nr:chemotaxis protein CheW [Caldilineaceae bacterium]
MAVVIGSPRVNGAKMGLGAGRSAASTAPAPEEHLVIFTLGNENYAVNIGDVWEINTMQKITHVPRAPHFIEGVINLRGEIIPVMDLRKRLGLEVRAHDRNSRVMVTQSSRNRLGLIVDGVQEVVKLPSSLVKPTAELGALIDEEFVRGVAQRNDQLIVLIDLQRLLRDEEEETIEMMELA